MQTLKHSNQLWTGLKNVRVSINRFKRRELGKAGACEFEGLVAYSSNVPNCGQAERCAKHSDKPDANQKSSIHLAGTTSGNFEWSEARSASARAGF